MRACCAGLRTGGRKGWKREGEDRGRKMSCARARNCSLRFSREDLRLRDLLDLRGKAKPSGKPR